MKNETNGILANTLQLTKDTLTKLKDKGFKYVQVYGYTTDKRLDYVQPNYFVLLPIRELSEDVEKTGIFEQIDSELLLQWANAYDQGIKVFISMI